MAQTTYDTIASPYNTVLHAFGELDPQYMPNGILFHAVVPLEMPLSYGGHYDRHPQNTLKPGRLGALAFTLQQAVMDTIQPTLFDTTYLKYFENSSDDEYVHHAGIHVQGGVFHNDALTLNQITVAADSSQFLQGPNISSTAYVTDTVFAFTPLTQNLPSGSVTHVFLPSNFYGNLPWGMPLEFDPGDGLGFRSLQLGDSIVVEYTSIDTARMELRYTAGGHTYRAFSEANVSPPQRPALGGSEPCVFTEVDDVSIEIAFANPDCEQSWFTNTIIVVDGIDPTLKQNVIFDDAYDKYADFRMPSGESVAELIAERGYDFVFINFKDGGQSIQ